ncbi:hypothetical protein C4D60_Mb06t18890 [Musa balbisiana]|uniref:Uncharacterized protein n=1 Tax=Musa balbisiana TaxID=52838 RepID=A0A4S8IP21_MUSBA|nr:hypothetical protein C4D60_Mb06t18890 [Musa balbisiana]
MNLRKQKKNQNLFFLFIGTTRLHVLLATAIILTFSVFVPLVTDDGECDDLNRWFTAFLVALCAASSVSFTFTNSYRAASGRLYYAVATLRGIRAFNGRRKGPPEPGTYRLTWSDLFHASLSLVAFLTIALLHDDVMRCYHIDRPRKLTNTVPLVIGFLFSVLFVVFPSRRRGTGYPFLSQGDAVYCRS